MRRLAAIALLPMAGVVSSQEGKAENNSSRQIDTTTMIIVPGINPTVEPPQGASFTIDGHDKPFFKLNLYSALITKKPIVLIFNGEATQGRSCATEDLKVLDYDAQEIEDGKFQIHARAKEGTLETQIKHVQESGCMIVTNPDRCKINFLNPLWNCK